MTRKVKRYLVLIGCANDKTGKSFGPGDEVMGKDFPAGVLKHWTEKKPPVLREVTHGDHN